jgi:hypothetical protein
VKTLIIWDNCEANLRFRLVDGDYSHLDGKYVNSAGLDEKVEKEIMELTLDPETGHTLPMDEHWPHERLKCFIEFIDNYGQRRYDPAELKVIVCGFIP